MNCPTCSQSVPRDTEGLIQARVATRIHAERAARETAQELVVMTETLKSIAVGHGWEAEDWDKCALLLGKGYPPHAHSPKGFRPQPR